MEGFVAEHPPLLQTFVAKWPPKPVTRPMFLICCHIRAGMVGISLGTGGVYVGPVRACLSNRGGCKLTAPTGEGVCHGLVPVVMSSWGMI